jgi:hypothetical protein
MPMSRMNPTASSRLRSRSKTGIEDFYDHGIDFRAMR